MRLPRILWMFIFMGMFTMSRGQTYFANGDAKSIGGSCYQLTTASDWQFGSVWYADKLDLNKNFDLEFDLNFGSKDDGADGIVFVLQTKGNTAIGASGGGIGFEGFSPSLGVEFDDWQNVDLGDPPSDHIAIFKNGSVNHNGGSIVSKAVSAMVNSGNIEDGANHLVRITWDPTSNLLEVWFDCIKRQRVIIDMVHSIFNGEHQVFWGFTSATGGSNNTHIVCLRDNILVQDSFYMCEGERIVLNARESGNNQYVWSPNVYLSDHTIQQPICDSPEPITYYVDYTDRCGKRVQDTIHVGVMEPPELSDLQDMVSCVDEKISLSVPNQYGTVLWNNDFEGETFELLNYEGPVFVKSRNICGSDSIEFNVSLNDCICDMWFPNVITPNQDGLNEEFGPQDICTQLTTYELSVYNRWGEKVFQTADVNQFWSGLNSTKNVVSGAYFYVVTWSNLKNGETIEHTQKGVVHVIQ